MISGSIANNVGIDIRPTANTANTTPKELGYYDQIKRVDPNNRSSGFGSHNVPQLMDNVSKNISADPLMGLLGMMGGDFEGMKPESAGSSGSQTSTPSGSSFGNGPASGGF